MTSGKRPEKDKSATTAKGHEISTPLSRLRRSVSHLERARRVLSARFRAWSAADNAQVRLGVDASEELGRVVDRVSSVLVALEAEGFVPPKLDQYRPPEEGERVRIVPKYRHKYAEKCADQLRACPTLFDDLVVSRVYSTSKTVLVGRAPFAPFEARRSHLVPVRRDR